jgi:hypothetical protein
MGLEDFLKDILGGIEEQMQDRERGFEESTRPSAEHARPSKVAQSESGIARVMRSVVQIVALRQGFLGGMSSAWTGSGTIVHPSGIILTNCHVANPRAMGMSSPPADRLGIAITDRSDEPPALSYFGECIASLPELDLAVIQIISDVKGRRATNLDLPAVAIGDSDSLELGDRLAILGYPGIGGETVTFTSGNVSGFTAEERIRVNRAWIKTDATIAGGNSGGTAVNQAGELVGIPTQAAAGRGITPVDARPVLDTNRDGRVDQRDTPMAVGGFINGLRPVNLAIPLLEKAGLRVDRDQSGRRQAAPSIFPGDRGRDMPQASQPGFRELLFSTRITTDGRPIHPTKHVPVGHETIYATFEFFDMKNGTPWSVVWMADDKVIIDQQDEWDDGSEGRKVVKVSNRKGLPQGEYHLVLGIGGTIALEGKVVVGSRIDESDTEISGAVVNAENGRPVNDALVMVLKPGESVRGFLRTQDKSAVLTSTETDRDGSFKLPDQLPKGIAYGLVVAARGFMPVAVEGALRVGPDAPEHADIGTVELKPR